MLVVEDGPVEQSWYSFRQWARQQSVVAFDTETTGLRPFHGDRLVGISVGISDQTWYLPFRHEVGPNLDEARLRETIAWLQTRDQLIGHNSKFDLHMLMKEGFQLPYHMPYTKDCEVLDTLIGAHLANENEKSFGLKPLCDKYGIGRGSRDEEELKERIVSDFRSELADARKVVQERKGSTEGVWKGMMWKLPPEQVAPYAETDVALTWGLLQEYLWPYMQAWGLVPLYQQVCNYNLLITKLEARGIKVDRDILHQTTLDAMERAEDAENRLWEATGLDNCNSYARVAKYFGVETTKEKPLKVAMLEGRVDREKGELLLDARGKRKVVDSYLIPYYSFVADDEAIHPSFRVHGTATGRLSCTDPNIMALPRNVTDQPAKAVFVARPGYVLVEIDLSQAELRVASHFAAQIAKNHATPDRYLSPNNPNLSKMGAVLASGEDLHTTTMIEMQQYLPSITRDEAKRVNLSAVFGIGAVKYAKEYAISFEYAKAALSAWRNIYPEFALLYSAADEIASRQGYITLPLSGRMRRYDSQFGSYTSQASSNWVQGTVADVMRIAMHYADLYLESQSGHLLFQVHDSLLMEIPEGDGVPEIVKAVQHIMTDPVMFGFMPPLKTEAKVGPSWGSMKVRETRHDSLGVPV